MLSAALSEWDFASPIPDDQRLFTPSAHACTCNGGSLGRLAIDVTMFTRSVDPNVSLFDRRQMGMNGQETRHLNLLKKQIILRRGRCGYICTCDVSHFLCRNMNMEGDFGNLSRWWAFHAFQARHEDERRKYDRLVLPARALLSSHYSCGFGWKNCESGMPLLLLSRPYRRHPIFNKKNVWRHFLHQSECDCRVTSFAGLRPTFKTGRRPWLVSDT